MVLPAIGWLAVLVLLAAVMSAVVRGFRGLRADSKHHPLAPGRSTAAPWIAASMYATAAMAMFGLLGAIRPGTATALALLALAGAAGAALKAHRKDAARQALRHAGAGFRHLGRDARTLWRLVAGSLGMAGDDEEGHAAPAVLTPATVAAMARTIPSLREDPALGTPPEPAVIADASPVPPPYAALAAWIGGFEAEDDQELRMFMEGCAAGSIAVAAAWHQAADRFLDSRLHPAFVAGILEVGDSEAESASHKVQAHRRFSVIYGAVKQWIGGNGPLPKDGDFLTGEDAA